MDKTHSFWTLISVPWGVELSLDFLNIDILDWIILSCVGLSWDTNSIPHPFSSYNN